MYLFNEEPLAYLNNEPLAYLDKEPLAARQLFEQSACCNTCVLACRKLMP